ncbi:hypothetical protein [Komagataeibacter kakiaceti]|uniref:hypothetical protein n=1 Tax=Komagataeibacter kakiaceti TaxID=943261 RepID=UPI001F582BA5|nr:hypothetical protein [Komagataeibacter kakiaceti]
MAQLLPDGSKRFNGFRHHKGHGGPKGENDYLSDPKGAHIHKEHVVDRLMNEVPNRLDNDLEYKIHLQTHHRYPDLDAERSVLVQPLQHADATSLHVSRDIAHGTIRAATPALGGAPGTGGLSAPRWHKMENAWYIREEGDASMRLSSQKPGSYLYVRTDSYTSIPAS